MHRLTLIHPIDPRGSKVGGIETHVRLMFEKHPADFSVLLVGMDERGDLEIGKPVRLTVGERQVDFLPVVHIADEEIHGAAKKLAQSVTLRFALGALRHIRTIRRLGRGDTATTELQRFEFALLGRLIGRPVVQLVHGEGSRKDRMDSLIKRFWYVNLLNERIALSLAARIVCVNAAIIERFKRIAPHFVAKSELLTVSVDDERFVPHAFPPIDPFRIVFAGRLDAFKDPSLMFETMRRLLSALGGALEFHYIGTSDPTRFAEFAAIETFTVRHGFKDAAGVAAIMGEAHAGILTSFFEGMPCYLLEMLASGRPVGAIRLPQFDPLVIAGESGFLVERAEDTVASADRLVEGFLELRNQIAAAHLDPTRIANRARPYSIKVQMPKLFARHRALAGTVAPSAAVAAEPR